MTNDILSIEEKDALRHTYMPLSANPDFQNMDNALINPYYDISVDYKNTSDVLGTDALDQAIENLICTEPGERLFNIDFWSPLYRVLFENGNNVSYVADQVYTQIEKYVPVTVNRDAAYISFNKYSNELEISIPYFFNFHGETRSHNFKRIIGR